MKSNKAKNDNRTDRTNSGNGNGKRAGFDFADVLFEVGLRGVNFFGAGSVLFWDEGNTAPASANGNGRKKESEQPVREKAEKVRPEFEMADRNGFDAFLPSVERCVW